VFTNTEVVLFYLFLRALDALGDHRALDTLAVLEAETVHHLGNALASKLAHEVVFQRYIENGRAGVTLTAGTTAQLSVYTTALVARGADDGQSAGIFHLLGELDIGTATGHIGGNSHSTQQAFLTLYERLRVFAHERGICVLVAIGGGSDEVGLVFHGRRLVGEGLSI